MFTRLRVTSLLVIWGTTLLFGCATQRSAGIDNFQIVDPDGIYRSGQPKNEADWDDLKKIGITTVVKLNEFPSAGEADEFRMAEARGIKVIPIYIQPDDWPHNWNPWVKPNEYAIMYAVELLEKRGNEKFLVHCAQGKDRTGLVVAAYKVRNEKFKLCKDAAYIEMKYYGTSPFLFGLKSVLDSPLIKERANCTHEYK